MTNIRDTVVYLWHNNMEYGTECKQKQFRLLRCFGSIDVGLVIYFLASGRANGYSRYSSMNMEHKILGINMDRGKETWTRNTYLYGFVVGDSVYLMPGSL